MSTYIVTNRSNNTVTIEGVEIAPGQAETVVFPGDLPLYVSGLADASLISLQRLSDAQGVVLIDPLTGLPYKAEAGPGGGSVDITTLTKEATQLQVLTALNNLDADVGTPATAVATSDTGAFPLIAFIKRGLERWTTLLSRIPASLGVKTSAASFPVVLASDQTTVNVSAVVRNCTGVQYLAVTNASLSLSPPANSVACLIQADGNTVRVTQDGTAASATNGLRVDDGVMYYVDTSLTSVRLFASVACNVAVTYFDKA